MSIRISDPLFLLSAQTGLSVGELVAKAAAGNPDMEKAQEALKTGDPIPLLFCRRRNGNGGVMVQPKITEASFSNTVNEEQQSINGVTSFVRPFEKVEIKYLAVLSEGEVPQLQVRDLFHGNCRRGTFNQTYDGRAGTWTPGNNLYSFFTYNATQNATYGYYEYDISTLTQGESVGYPKNYYYKDTDNVINNFERKDYGFPVFCGTSGSYSGLTTLSFEYDFDTTHKTKDLEPLKKTINAFIREGLRVTRLVDSVTGSSDNFADLAKYLFQKNNRLADDLIDNTALTTAAKFADANGFFFNGELKESQNLLDWLQATSVNFLLRVSSSGGKFGLLPKLPYNTDHTIKTTQITPEFTFTEEHITDGGFEIEYISLEDKEPVCFVVQWRQQPEADFGLVRTVEVRTTGEAANGPFVNIDLSDYCTNEDHAVKVGAFRLAQRKFITHHLRLTVRERSYNASLVVGDIVRVRLRRETNKGEVEHHDKLYEINRIEKTFSSTIVYDLTHFPIDSEGRSLVARVVASASGAGNTINVGRSTFDCDENSSTDSSSIGSSSGGGGSNQPPAGDTGLEIQLPLDADGSTQSADAPFPGGSNNPPDPLEGEAGNTSAATISGSNTGYGGSSATPGNQVQVAASELACANGRVCYYRLDKRTGVRTLRECVTTPIAGNFSSYITTADIDHWIVAEGQCPDSSSEDGFGPPIPFGETLIVVPDPTQYTYVRFVGRRTTYTYPDNNLVTEPVSSGWFQQDGSSTEPYMSVGSAWGAYGGFIYNFRPSESYRYVHPASAEVDFSPWVNYYDYTTNQWVGDGPNTVGVPWRANVFAQGRKFTTSAGYGLRIGNIGARGFYTLNPTPANPFYSSQGFVARLPANTTSSNELRRVSIEGEWEFSNDGGTTVLLRWGGTDDNGDPQYNIYNV